MASERAIKNVLPQEMTRCVHSHAKTHHDNEKKQQDDNVVDFRRHGVRSIHCFTMYMGHRSIRHQSQNLRLNNVYHPLMLWPSKNFFSKTPLMVARRN